jgi:protein-tyrosine phosphatase
VIAAYLLYVGLLSDPIEALAYFAKKRSYERETPDALKLRDRNEQVSYILSLGGVNSPSQIR